MTDEVAPPIRFRWLGDHMEPVSTRDRQEADKYYVVGAVYKLAPWFDRSGVSHNHEFAFVEEAFDNLPEHLAPMFRDSTALRKWALCKAGFCSVRKTVYANSKAQAKDLYLALGGDYDYAVISDDLIAVTFMKAESQKRSKANAKRFQAQKTGIIEVLEDLLGVEPGSLVANAEQVA
jgi:hypothetical protein